MPALCNGSNTRYRFDDIGMAVFSVFLMQSPSFLDHQQRFHEAHIRHTLDGCDYQQLDPAFDHAVEQLNQNQGLNDFRRLDGRILIALDGC